MARMVVLSLLVTGAVSLTSNAFAQSVQKDVEYARIGDRVLALDFHPPKEADGRTPVVVWVHGGAWRSGSKNDVPVRRWTEQGLAIASVDYRLSPEAQFPAQIHDIKAGIRFLQANADKYGIDGDKVIVAGSSAGGHLAALVGVSNGVKQLEGEVGVSSARPARVSATVSSSALPTWNRFSVNRRNMD